MNVNEKGLTGLIEVIRDLTRKGYECFTPFNDFSAVDLIIMNKEYQTIRLQVKYRAFDKSEQIQLELFSIVNGKKIPINRSAIDAYAIYIPDVDCVCYYPITDIASDKRSFIVRKSPGKSTINVDKKPAPVYSELLDEMRLWNGVRAGR